MWKNLLQKLFLQTYLNTKPNFLINCIRLKGTCKSSSLHAKNLTSVAGLRKINVHKSFITLDNELHKQPLNINLTWLRDHCRCSECYNYATHQRKQSILDFAQNTSVKEYILENDSLKITWIDNHTSNYNLEWLLEYYCDHRTIKSPILWNKNSVQSLNIANIDANVFLKSDECVKELLESIILYGVAFVKNVLPTKEATEQITQKISHAQRTFFGDMWEFSDSFDQQDTAYTREALVVHTDNTYFSEAAGLQVFHCIHHDGDGGETVLVDGFYAANTLKQKYFQSYNRLTKNIIESEFKGSDKHYLAIGPILKLDLLTGELEQIRFNMIDRAPLRTIPMENIQQFYEDFIHFSKIIYDPINEWWFKLQPGTVLIFNNWRVLHGRAAYTGHRKIAGCYIGYSDWCSKARLLGLL